jgi:hypothetical protein
LWHGHYKATEGGGAAEHQEGGWRRAQEEDDQQAAEEDPHRSREAGEQGQAAEEALTSVSRASKRSLPNSSSRRSPTRQPRRVSKYQVELGDHSVEQFVRTCHNHRRSAESGT